MEPKVIVFSAPSGSGKSTIINYLLEQGLPLEFSISATSRAPRGKEQNGVEYYFLTPDEFRRRIEAGDFLEYEEVYADRFYGTLRSEVDRIAAKDKITIFDVDVHGAMNIKKAFGDKAMTLFIQPPSIDELRNRLVGRGTDSMEVIEQRIARAEYEMGFASKFDKIVVNDQLSVAQCVALESVREFMAR